MVGGNSYTDFNTILPHQKGRRKGRQPSSSRTARRRPRARREPVRAMVPPRGLSVCVCVSPFVLVYRAREFPAHLPGVTKRLCAAFDRFAARYCSLSRLNRRKGREPWSPRWGVLSSALAREAKRRDPSPEPSMGRGCATTRRRRDDEALARDEARARAVSRRNNLHVKKELPRGRA